MSGEVAQVWGGKFLCEVWGADVILYVNWGGSVNLYSYDVYVCV